MNNKKLRAAFSALYYYFRQPKTVFDIKDAIKGCLVVLVVLAAFTWLVVIS